MGNKVSEEFIREFFKENKEKFNSLQGKFMDILWGYSNLPVLDNDIELDLSQDKIVIHFGDTRLTYREDIYAWNCLEEEENDGNAVRAD